MAFVCCDACGWGQDDFWEPDGYTPLREDIVDDLRRSLFADRIHFDDHFFAEHPELKPDGTDAEGPWVRGTAYVAWDLRRRADRIEDVVYRTQAEFDARGADRWKCPECGGRISID